MAPPPRIIIVGTGPAAVSAAFPLVEAGLQVCLVDAGEHSLAPPPPDRPSLAELRHGAPGAQAYLLGRDLGGLRDMSAYSPKLRTAASPAFVDSFASANSIGATNFDLVGTTSIGGLSNIWGAVCSVFDSSELALPDAERKALSSSYQAVAARIGISGSLDDDMAEFHGLNLPLQSPLPLSPAAQALLRRYETSARRPEFRLGRSRNAVLSADLGDRHGCAEDNACMWGCRNRSIYNAAFDLDELEKRNNVEVIRGVVVGRVGWDGGPVVFGRRKTGENFSLGAERVLLACGAVASARLALDAIDRRDDEVPLVSAPAAAFAVVLPSRLGSAVAAHAFGMSQLSFRITLGEPYGDYASGLLYDASSFSVADLAAHMPLTRYGAASLMGGLLPCLMIGLVYLPGELSASKAVLRHDADGQSRLDVVGGFATLHERACRILARELRRSLGAIGAWLIPGSFRPYRPGAEVHYGGILPMGGATTFDGEIQGFPGLHVIDGAILPRVPAKHHTFTVMGNADRIGRAISGRAQHA